MKDLAKDSAKDIAQLHSRLHPIVAECCLQGGAYLVALEIRGSRERRIVEIFVDKPEGISLDECGELSHMLGEMLEEMNAFPMAYRLEVSSPGVERPLQYIWQYERNVGRLLSAELADGTSLKGRISAVEGDTITLESPAKNGTKNGKQTKTPNALSNQAAPEVSAVPIFPLTLPQGTIKRAVVELEF
ncbi:MAG: ribosome maturation factor RimP [Candidatus Kapabacteria bacterium]|nr:ribosome maturation factor RimP [Candidatus Kapabacteria bacterium]